MARMKRRGDIDSTYSAIRPRLGSVGGGTSSGGSTTVPAHTHSASQIVFEPANLLAADDVQEGMEELDSEKLARDGSQAWVGPDALDMNHFDVNQVNDISVENNIEMSGGVGAAILNLVRQITMTGIGLIENVLKIDFTGSGIGDGIIDQPRVIHMNGDHVDDEAKIDGLERVVFNAEPTASSIENPSRIEMNVGVAAGTNYTAAEGIASWDTLEDTMVFYVQSGAGVVAIAVGWGVLNAVNGVSPPV